MAGVCPNVNSPEWKDLVAHFGNSKLKAIDAFRRNGNKIPSVDSDIVKEIKDSNLSFGTKVEVVLDKDGNETDEYAEVKEDGTRGKKVFSRISNFVKNFSARSINKDKTFSERVTDRLWGDDPHDEKHYNPVTGQWQTYDEHKAGFENKVSENAIRGEIIHKAIWGMTDTAEAERLGKEIQELEAEVKDEHGMMPFAWDWIKDEGVIEGIFEKVGINYFHEYEETMDEILRDELYSEVSIASSKIGLAGTMDMLVKHGDGKYSIVDWKTGNTMNKFFRGMDDLLMKYGDQASNEVVDSIRNRAKLQVAMYAVLMRAENPDIEFRNLTVGWIPSMYDSLRDDPDMNVDVRSFIPMIEKFFSDPVLLKEAGVPVGIRDKLLEADPDIFNPKVYSSNVTTDVANEILSSEQTPEEILKEKIDELRYILAKNIDYAQLHPDDKIKAQELTDQIQQFLADPEMVNNKDLHEDLSPLATYLGNYSEVTHPMVVSWKNFKDSQLDKAKATTRAKVHKFNSLLRPFLKEYDKTHGIKNILGNKAYNYDKLYGWMYVTDKVDEEKAEPSERLLTSTEESAEFKAKYDSLTKTQKALLDYVNEEFSSYFVGDKAFANEDATQHKGAWLSHLGLFNKGKKAGDQFHWSKGFFFKVEPSDEDLILRRGKGSELKGRLSRQAIGSMLYKYATHFREQQYEGWDEENQALPIKYLGNQYINSSRAYTRNIETIFNKGIYAMEYKKRMDGVYSLGIAIKNKLDATTIPGSIQPAYKNLVKFLDLKLQMDIQRKIRMSNPRSRSIRIPMYTPQGWQKHKVSLDAVLRSLTKWASMNTMWMRPYQGIGNGVHATLLTHRDGLKGSISQIKLLGIEGNSIDFTHKEIMHAEALYVKDYLGSSIKGNFRKSKMYLLAKELDYFGNNFDYAEMEKSTLSLRNRHISESAMYMFHSLPEEFVSMTTMTAQLLHMKNEKTGKSIWESYKVEEVIGKDGKGTGEHHLVWKGGVRGYVAKGDGVTRTTEKLTALNAKEKAKLRKVHERLQGGYRKDEAAVIEIWALGKAAIHLKKYFPRLIFNAIHKKRSETDLGYYKKLIDKETGKPVMKDEDGNEIPMYEWIARTTEGRWITLANQVFSLFGVLNNDFSWSKLASEQKQNLIEAGLTLAIFIGTYGAYLSLFPDEDDDDTYKKWWNMYLVDNLSQQYNPVDLLRSTKNIMSPVSFAKLAQFAIQGTLMMRAGANYAFGNEDAALTKAGDLKGWNTFAKTIPVLSSIKDFMNKVEHSSDDSWLSSTYGDIRLK